MRGIGGTVRKTQPGFCSLYAGNAIADGRGFNARQLWQLREKSLIEPCDCRIFIRQAHKSGKEPLWPEAQVGVHQLPQTAQQQTGSDDENQGKPDLGDNEEVSSRTPQ